MTRIMIVGRNGAGKSTFAKKLQAKTHLSLYHLDKYFFTDHWVERDEKEFMDFQEKIVATDHWIIDGNCRRSLETRYKRATVCIYFNVNKWVCLWRILKRRFFKDQTIDDRAPQCREHLSWKLITYCWQFEKRVGASLFILKEKYPHVIWIEMKRVRDADELPHLSWKDERELCTKTIQTSIKI